MRVVHELPPPKVYNACRKKFGVKFDDGVCWTYGDTIFTKYPITDKSLIKHEATHYTQQRKIGVIAWWDKYLADEEFRFSQELEAYQKQYQHYCYFNKNKEQRFLYLRRIATDLSGPMYGNLCTRAEALKLIKDGKRT